jgi:Lsr2
MRGTVGQKRAERFPGPASGRGGAIARPWRRDKGIPGSISGKANAAGRALAARKKQRRTALRRVPATAAMCTVCDKPLAYPASPLRIGMRCEVLRRCQAKLLLPPTEWSTMAQKIQTLFIDDIDGGEAEGTVRFSLDGAEYEIDLCAAHNAELRNALGKYVSHARKVTARGARPAGRAAGRRPSSLDTTAVRSWARDNGIDIKERGRVPADVVAKYQAAVGALAAASHLEARISMTGPESLRHAAFRAR